MTTATPDDIAAAVARVKREKPGPNRTAVVQEFLHGRVVVGVAIPGFDRKRDTIAAGNVRVARGSYNRAGAMELHRRALFISELTRQKVWP